MGRLPSWGVAWYRKALDIAAADAGKSIFLDMNGAMSYAAVWLNGQIVGGWPYGYASWRLDLTPYIAPGGRNQLAIRLDNPPSSSRWYPGGGIYRSVALTKTSPLHVGQWGTSISTPHVSRDSATIDVDVTIDNDSDRRDTVSVLTQIYTFDRAGARPATPVATVPAADVIVPPRSQATAAGSVRLANPRRWGPPPTQQPHRYVAVTTVSQRGRAVDSYATPFGIRELRFDANRGLLVNGERIVIKGVNQHHDLGALGAAFNVRAAERQLETLAEMGANAIRTAHNPPSPELLDLTDSMGLLVVDELFDVWERHKAPLDFHLIFRDWHEPEARAWVRRDRNHPSVIMWSIGNEIFEAPDSSGYRIAKRLSDEIRKLDPTRPVTDAIVFLPGKRARFASRAAQMRHEHHVLKRQQVGMHHRLPLEDVERRAGNKALLQRPGKRAFVHDRATRCVDEIRRPFHPRERRPIDQMPGVVAQRYVQRDDVGG